jgi:hypothetical protein
VKALVSLAQAKLHLRADSSTHEDADIELKILAASLAVLNYMETGADAFLDTDGQVPTDTARDPYGVPEDVRAATLILLGDFYRNRDGENNSEYEFGVLPRVVVSILYPYRTPSMA